MKARLIPQIRLRRALFLACSLGLSGLILGKPGFAQQINPKVAADEVYRQLPDLPRETQHLRKKGNEPTNSSLISRVIQYHTLVKGRAPQYRFDWKITLADYLGIHESMREETYPGRAFLKKNPLESDRKSIQQLTRQQRLALTQTLSDIYAGQTRQQEATTPPAAPKPKAPAADGVEPKTSESQPRESAEPSPPTLTPLPSSGGADLLQGPAPQSIPSPSSTPSESTTPPANQRPTDDSQQLSF